MPRKKNPHQATNHDDDAHHVELGTAGRIVIPLTIRNELDLNEGDMVRIRSRHGRVVISKPDGDRKFASETLGKLAKNGS